MRRLITVPALWVSTVLFTVGAPLLLLIGLTRPTGVRGALFLLLWLWSECAGVVLALLLTPLLLHTPTSHAAHAALQRGWSGSLWRGLTLLYGLELRVTGQTGPAPFLLLLRHVSAADTLLPQVLIANRQKLRLRYVLKEELRWDPALDIVGERLPNAFIRRGERQLGKIAELGVALGPRDGVALWPEGTRFTAQRRERLLTKVPRARELVATLPPRLGGVQAVLDAAPLEVVFCAHRGFEGVRGLSDLWNGELLGKVIEVELWRLPAPSEGLEDWLFAQWQRVDEFAAGAP